MFLLTLFQGEREVQLAAFDTLEEGRQFVQQLPDYREEDGEESFEAGQLQDYQEIYFNGHLVPLTRFMFDPDERVTIEWLELPNLSQKGEGLVEGVTRVDAYHVDNQDVKDYISIREDRFTHVKAVLEEKGYQVDRQYAGSEDGEAILYRKAGEDWHFLCHLDPFFVEGGWNLSELLEELIK